MWECPITTYIDEIINQQKVERENAITLKVSETIGVDVNREELIKALNYDRHQYEKGYADAKAEFAPKWTKVEDGLPEESENYLVVIRERFNKEHWWIDICDIDTDGFVKTWNVREPYYVEAWMPIPKYEGVIE